MNRAKAIEILYLNLKQAGKQMPPDVRDALKFAISDMVGYESSLDPGGVPPLEAPHQDLLT